MNTSTEARQNNLNASFVIPVNNRGLFRQLEENLERRFTDYQVIPVEGASSFFDAWRQGVPQANRQYLVLTHQDVKFKSFPRLEGLFRDDVGMVGIAGSRVIEKDNPWWANDYISRLLKRKLSGSIYHGRYGKLGVLSYFGPRGEVAVLDGVCLVTPKETLERVGIPDQDWASWHFYDHILSLRYRQEEQRLMTAPINMYHHSTGDAGSEKFNQIRDRFVQEYFKSTDKYSVS